MFRALDPAAWKAFEALRRSGILKKLSDSGQVVATWLVDPSTVPPQLSECIDGRRLIEHACIPYISYPYEWPFSLLKKAALHHLELQMELLDAGFTLSDASAYNVQFRGTKPVFIDIPSIRAYEAGQYWAGYRQFCEQFLNPLLITSLTGVPHHAWFRGSMEGLDVEHLARILPARACLSWRSLVHIILHARMIASADRGDRAALKVASAGRWSMSKAALVWLLGSMRTWIAGL